MKSFSSFVFPLSDLSVIELHGDDAMGFLQGQLTNDVAALDADRACLAGYCTAKGRLLGSMVVWRSGRGEDAALRLLVKADLAEALLKRLSMFVLRAKVKLSLTALKVYGVTPVTALPQSAASQLQLNLDPTLEPPAAAAAWTVHHDAHGSWIAAPAAGDQARWWLISESSRVPDATGEHSDAWRVADIAAGLPWIQAATQDLFIPQTLNLDLIQAVSFTKGCYPGQEVVARSHYRGTVKRRMAQGVIKTSHGLDTLALPGQDTFDAKRPEAPCGRLVNAAVGLDDSVYVLMEIQLADLETAAFRLGSAEGPELQVQALPYPIQDA